METIGQRNENTNIFINIIIGSIGFFIFLWITSIVWVTKDIHARTSSVVLQMFCIGLITVLTPLIGLPLYFIVRPIYYKQYPKDTKK